MIENMSPGQEGGGRWSKGFDVGQTELELGLALS